MITMRLWHKSQMPKHIRRSAKQNNLYRIDSYSFDSARLGPDQFWHEASLQPRLRSILAWPPSCNPVYFLARCSAAERDLRRLSLGAQRCDACVPVEIRVVFVLETMTRTWGYCQSCGRWKGKCVKLENKRYVKLKPNSNDVLNT